MVLNDYEKKHLQELRKGLSECMVLLKSNGDFPLEDVTTIALYGNGARKTIKGGTGSGEVNSRYYDTVELGLKKGGFQISSEAWLSAYDQIHMRARENFIQEVKRRAKKKHVPAIYEGMGAVMPEPEYELPLDAKADVAIYVLSRVSGEGNDRLVTGGDVLLTKTEQRDILACAKKYKKFLLVLNVGGPVDLTPVLEVENILLLSQLGVQMGRALADVLLGVTTPSGKLTTTWATADAYPEFMEFGKVDDTKYTEGVYVGYRYFDSVAKEVLYPFGYGLSYTTFSMKCNKISMDQKNVILEVDVTNTGTFAGKEVIQVYVSVPEGKLDQPYQTLAAFAKTKELEPKETETVKISFDLTEIASYSEEKAAYILEKGDYVVRVGNSSANTKPCGVLVMPKTVVVRQVKNALGNPGFDDYKPTPLPKETLGDDINRISVDTKYFSTEEIMYNKSWKIIPEVKKLSDKELAKLLVGAFSEKTGPLSIIGNASSGVAGAAGQSAAVGDIPSMIMADGPAGLRLSQKYFEDEKGVHSLGATFPESFADYMPEIVKKIMNSMAAKPTKETVIKEQYATAIPIGTAIAQSWNLEFAQKCGDIVGDEMQRFGVHLWLAPALNIHRSILCGRNFEYFSEDPLISGRFAAAITNGVQKHAGCGTTIKHFAANNQETNRYNNSSMVSERALREIYLRGFEICVKESQPKAVMTSYNLINGVHTAESRDLTEDILRQEFGFEGIVMTDWVISKMTGKNPKYPQSEPWKVVMAGGDLFMPGSKMDWKNILKAIKEEKLSRNQLLINGSRIYKMAKNLTN